MKLFSFSRDDSKDDEQIRQAAIEKRKAKQLKRAKKIARKAHIKFKRKFRRGKAHPEVYCYNASSSLLMGWHIENELKALMGEVNFEILLRERMSGSYYALRLK